MIIFQRYMQVSATTKYYIQKCSKPIIELKIY